MSSLLATPELSLTDQVIKASYTAGGISTPPELVALLSGNGLGEFNAKAV